jgi:carboxypeptidase family protein
MTRRLPVLLVVLVAALLAAWLFGARPARTARSPSEAASRGSAAPSTPGPVLEPASAAGQVPPREAIEPARTDVSPVEVAQVAEDGALLVVLAHDAASGAPLPRVRMTVMPRPPASSSSTHVDGTTGTLDSSPLSGADGRAEFELPSGVELRLMASGEEENVGRATLEIPALTPGERREITVELPTRDDVLYFGRVLAREDRSPVSGAGIRLVRGQVWFTQTGGEDGVEHHEEILLQEQTTGPDGFFELSLASWKNPDIRIQAPGFAPVFLEIGREHDTPEKASVVLLARAATLRARLLESTGTAVADGVVRLWTESYHLGLSDHGGVYLPSSPDPHWEGRTDPSGLCALQELPPDVPLHVEVARGGQRVKRDLPTLSLSPGEVHEVEWKLDSGCRLEGSVVDQDGESVQGQTLWLQRADFDAPRFFEKYHSGELVLEARSGPDGRFSFSDVSPGKWWIGPAGERDDDEAPDPAGIAPLARVIEVQEGVLRQEVVVLVHRGLYIRGHALDPAGEPVPDTYIWGNSESAGWVLSTTTGQDGAFAIGPLVPGRYALIAHGWTHADSEPVEANGGDEGVVLRLRAGGRLSGTIRDGATGRASEAEVTYVRAEAPEGWGMTRTKEDGSFLIEGCVPGTYSLSVRASGQRVGMLRDVSVRAGAETGDLVVILAPGALLRVKYAGNQGYLQYRVVSEGMTIAGDGVPAGGSSEIVVPSGRSLLECEWAGTAESQEIELAVGEEKEVVVGGGG